MALDLEDGPPHQGMALSSARQSTEEPQTTIITPNPSEAPTTGHQIRMEKKPPGGFFLVGCLVGFYS